ncbi:hypothetical protein SK128_023998 [Halocaridina rubra]|uniref:HTH CENPB-type domain-containing protein n=1 Tax=Halocaridina rubra TaxID=373956 RepID=A0AAN8X281_HALRR
MLEKIPAVELPNGHNMPVIGLGTYKSSKEELRAALTAALECGYRHIDTAWAYQNEDVIGDVLKEWITQGKVKRGELFITTKLPAQGNRPSDVDKFMNLSLKNLKLDYVDLYLIHTPFTSISTGPEDIFGKLLDHSTDLEAVYKEMEKQVDAGKTKAIGLSNFNSKQIERIMKICRIKPSNLQVEVHVYHQQKPLRSICRQHDIPVCAFAPIGAPYIPRNEAENEKYPPLLEHPTVTSMAFRLNKMPAQILLRFLIQLGLIVIPKSIFDFKLPPSDMADLDLLDRGSDDNAGRLYKFLTREGQRSHLIIEMERLLLLWFDDQNQERIPLSLMLIQEKAKVLFRALKR